MADLRTFFAPCPAGLESILADELREVGGEAIHEGRGGVSFRGTSAVGYAAALWSRVAMRVLEELTRGHISDANQIYDLTREVPWQIHLRSGQTLAVHSVARSRHLAHAHYAALKVKDAIVDQLREDTGQRPDVDPKRPDLPLRIVVLGDQAILYRDLVGGSLHRRGYRGAQHKSPLNEALAAGLLQMTGWDRKSPLCDPLCGSATLLVEAGHLAGDRAPGLRREYAFERWPDHDRTAWEALLDDAEARWEAGQHQIPPLLGNDRHPGAIALARHCIARAGIERRVTLSETPLADYHPPETPGVVVANPPYGERLDEPDLIDTYRDLGNFLKQHCGGAVAWVLSGAPELTRHIRLRASRKVPVLNGSIDCRWLSYEIRGRRDPAVQATSDPSQET